MVIQHIIVREMDFLQPLLSTARLFKGVKLC